MILRCLHFVLHYTFRCQSPITHTGGGDLLLLYRLSWLCWLCPLLCRSWHHTILFANCDSFFYPIEVFSRKTLYVLACVFLSHFQSFRSSIEVFWSTLNWFFCTVLAQDILKDLAEAVYSLEILYVAMTKLFLISLGGHFISHFRLLVA